MRPHRTLLLLALLPLAVAGCGGDDEPAPTAGSASTTARPGDNGDRSHDCRAEIRLGDGATWRGRAQVRLRGAGASGSGPDATYTAHYAARHGAVDVSVFSAGTDFAPAVTVVDRGAALTSSPEPFPGQGVPGLDPAADGSGATADLDLGGADGSVTRLTARFTCATA